MADVKTGHQIPVILKQIANKFMEKQPMNIAFNARVLNERKGGPARYTHEILRVLAGKDFINTYYIFCYDEPELDFTLPGNFRIRILKPRSRMIFDYILLPVYSYLYRIDLFFFPKNTFSPLIRGKKVPFFNDIVYFEKLGFREFKFFDNLHHTLMVPVAARFSYINLSISEFTASRMTELLGIDREMIRVIHLGIEKRFRKITDISLLSDTAEKFGIHKPFLFYAGSLSPRKNMANIIKAFSLIKNQIPHCIYVTGGYSWRDDRVFALIKENRLEDRIIKLGFLSDEELIALYNMADCYLYPSIYEGFGLPILESQACGCPVITSTVSSCPEVAGDGAFLVDPYDVRGLADAIVRITTDRNYREELVGRGFKNASRFSWDQSARVLLDLIDEIESEER